MDLYAKTDVSKFVTTHVRSSSFSDGGIFILNGQFAMNDGSVQLFKN